MPWNLIFLSVAFVRWRAARKPEVNEESSAHTITLPLLQANPVLVGL